MDNIKDKKIIIATFIEYKIPLYVCKLLPEYLKECHLLFNPVRCHCFSKETLVV